MGRTNKDILDYIGDRAEDIRRVISESEKDGDTNLVSCMQMMRSKAEGILEIIATMRKYRELRTKEIFVFDPEKQDFYAADKTQKMKIARKMLIDAGIID